MSKKTDIRYIIVSNKNGKFLQHIQHWSNYLSLRYYTRTSTSTDKTIKDIKSGDVYLDDLKGIKVFKTLEGAERCIAKYKDKIIQTPKDQGGRKTENKRIMNEMVPMEVVIQPNEECIVNFNDYSIGKVRQLTGKTTSQACVRCGMVVKNINYINIKKSLSSINICPICLIELGTVGKTILDSKGEEWTKAVQKERFINNLIKQ